MKIKSLVIYSVFFSLTLIISLAPKVSSLEFEESDDYDYWFYYNGIGRISNIALSSDGEYFAGGGNGYLYLFHKSNWAYLWRYSTTGNPQSIDISSDGSYIVSGYPTGTIYFHAKEVASPLWSSVISTNTDAHVAISEKGSYIGAAAMVSPSIGDTRVRFYNYSDSTPLWSYDILSTGGGTSEIEISSDGKYIAVGAPGYHLYFFNTTFASPKVPMWSYDVGSSIVDLKMSSSGQYVIVNSQLNGIFVFNTTSLTPDIPLWNFPMPNPSYQIDISLGGDFLVAGNHTSLWLFNILSPVPIWNVSMQVTSLAISGDGNFIVAGSYPHNISFFTKENNTMLWTYDVYDGIDSIKMSNHGETFIVGSQSLYCFYRSVRGTGFLDVDMLDQIYTEEKFDVMFAVKDVNGEGIDSASIQMWWNGTDVSSDVQNIGLGVYRVLLDPIMVSLGELPILLNMSISAGGYNDKYYETSIAVDPAIFVTVLLDVDMLDQIYTEENFDIMFAVKDVSGEGVDSASIQMWWNGTDVSSDVQNIGLGVYRVLLDPITVNPGELPILLNMSIFAEGFDDTYYETSLAVDPALIKSETPNIPPSIPGYDFLLIFGMLGIICFLIFRRKTGQS